MKLNYNEDIANSGGRVVHGRTGRGKSSYQIVAECLKCEQPPWSAGFDAHQAWVKRVEQQAFDFRFKDNYFWMEKWIKYVCGGGDNMHGFRRKY